MSDELIGMQVLGATGDDVGGVLVKEKRGLIECFRHGNASRSVVLRMS